MLYVLLLSEVYSGALMNFRWEHFDCFNEYVYVSGLLNQLISVCFTKVSVCSIPFYQDNSSDDEERVR